MHCYICDKLLLDSEVKVDPLSPKNKLLPCSNCLDKIRNLGYNNLNDPEEEGDLIAYYDIDEGYPALDESTYVPNDNNKEDYDE